MLLRRRRVAVVDDGAGLGARFFAVPRPLVGLAAAGRCAPPDCQSRSPTSPLDLRAFPALGGGSLLLRSPRSPRSWDSHRVGLGGIVDDDTLADPKNRLLGPQMRPSFTLRLVAQSCASEPRGCACPRPPPEAELGNVADLAGAGGVPVPCSKSYRELKSGPEPIIVVPAAAGGGAQLGTSSSSSLSADLCKFPAPGSLPGRDRGRYVGSVSATEVEQSEDYTCIIAHGPNPKTTRIFGDCILEPITARVPPPPDGHSVEVMEVKEAAESYWLVNCSGGEEFSDSCLSYKGKLGGSGGCICRGDGAFCSVNCGDQEILVEEEEEKSMPMSPFSSSGSSSSNDDIFMVGMVVLTGPS